MRATITIVCDVPSIQKLTALRQACHEWVDADPDVKVTASNSAIDETPFTVLGSIKGKPDESWREVVMACDAEAAKAAAAKADTKRTIVAVFAGELQPIT